MVRSAGRRSRRTIAVAAAEEPAIMRRIVRCSWRCRNCGTVIGSENVAIYGRELPDVVRGSGFFAGMTLLDHLRDCAKKDYSDELQQSYGRDFLKSPAIWEWFSRHAQRESQLVAEEELD